MSLSVPHNGWPVTTTRTPKKWTKDEDDILLRETEAQGKWPLSIRVEEYVVAWDCLGRAGPFVWLELDAFLVSRGKLKDWHRIAAAIPGRNNKDCRKRWCKINGESRKGLWEPDEDDRLQAGVRMHGFRYSSSVGGHYNIKLGNDSPRLQVDSGSARS